eukprot:NODE_160_length_16633_cov_0.230132.p15 type:complete len:100 gc:universal NODE_160_length_16633_cov_0.230132:11965-11666(-)
MSYKLDLSMFIFPCLLIAGRRIVIHLGPLNPSIFGLYNTTASSTPLWSVIVNIVPRKLLLTFPRYLSALASVYIRYVWVPNCFLECNRYSSSVLSRKRS